MRFTAERLLLVSKLNRALRRQDWPEAMRLLQEAGLTDHQAAVLLLEEYDARTRPA